MINILKLIVLINSLIALVGFALFASSGYLIYSLIATNCVAVFLCRKNQVTLITLIFIFTYNFHYYLQYQGAQLSPYLEFQNSFYYGIGVAINLVLLTSFISFLDIDSIKNKEKLAVFSLIINRVSSEILYYVCFFCCLVIIAYLSTKGYNLFYSNGNLYELYKLNLDSIGGIAVYFCIFFFCMFVFKPSNLGALCIHIVFYMFLLFALSRGTRMLIVPPLLIYFFYFFENKISSIFLVGFAGFGMAILTAIDRFKNGINIFEDNTKGSDIIINNQAEILYGANGVIAIIHEGFVPIFQRVKLAYGLFLTGFIPPGMFNDSWKYPHFTSLYNASAGGGGLASIGFYAMFSWFGPILLGMYLAIMCNYTYSSKKRNIFVRLTFAMSFFMVTRWYAYDANVLIRLPFYTIIFFCICIFSIGKGAEKL